MKFTLRWANFVLAGVFGLGAVVRGGAFAKWDTRLYSPLPAFVPGGCARVAIGV